MLVHFPSALYPFSLVLDILYLISDDSGFRVASLYALETAVGMSVLAMIYGAIDFFQIGTQHKAWKKAGLHGLINGCCWIVFVSLLLYRIKHPDINWIYIGITSGGLAGMIFSDYLGADLIIKHKIGIED